MDRMIARRRQQISIGAGGDGVMFGISLPSDTVVHDINAKVHILSQSETVTALKAVMYGVEGWILPIHDPDAAAEYNTVWDTLVPKDTDVQTMDLDTGAADATPFFEPGETDWTMLFDVGLRPEKIYSRYRMLTMTNGSVFSYQDNQSPFAVNWFPGEGFTIRIKRRLRVRQPSLLVFGLASPSMDDKTNSLPTVLAEAKWAQVKYIGEVLERAYLHVLGLTEAGAETPWEEATALLQEHLEPDMHEGGTGAFEAVTWRSFIDAKVDHSVPGRLGKATITTGR